jgi:hypothetical protein
MKTLTPSQARLALALIETVRPPKRVSRLFGGPVLAHVVSERAELVAALTSIATPAKETQP